MAQQEETYKYMDASLTTVIRGSDGAFIPNDKGNPDFIAVVIFQKIGGIIAVPDPIPTPEPVVTQEPTPDPLIAQVAALEVSVESIKSSVDTLQVTMATAQPIAQTAAPAQAQVP